MSNTATILQGQEILALQDELTGALIGLVRSCGNNTKTENTDEIIIEGLVHTITNSNIGVAALKAMIEKVREEKNYRRTGLRSLCSTVWQYLRI